MAKATRSRRRACAAFWGVYKITSEGFELVQGIGRTREDAVKAAARELGCLPHSENLLSAKGLRQRQATSGPNGETSGYLSLPIGFLQRPQPTVEVGDSRRIGFGLPHRGTRNWP